MRNSVIKFAIVISLTIGYNTLKAQTVYPEPMVDQSSVSAGPDAQSFQTYGNEPTALYEGLPAIGIPIYNVKCGSLSMPVSLSYNFSGLSPMQEASWVGLGWNLN